MNENFSGTGPFSASGGQTGFDSDGWTNIGNPGSFSTNGFGESIYAQSTVAPPSVLVQDGLIRTIGAEDFNLAFEFSNPAFSSTTAGNVYVGMTDSANPGSVIQLTFQPNNSAHLFYSPDALNYVQAGSFTATEAVERVTLYMNYALDPTLGGSTFEAFVEFNESGTIHFVGAFDAGQIPIPGSDNRNLFVLTSAFQGSTLTTVSAEFDRFSITSPVPEPSVLLLAAIAGPFLTLRRRRSIESLTTFPAN